MGVNWKRGLFRVWVALTASWLIVVSALGISGFFSPLPAVPEIGMIEKSIDIARKYRGATFPIEERQQYEKALKKGLLTAVRFMPGKTNELEITLADETTISNVPAETETKEIERRISNFFKNKRENELKSRILEASGMLFLPPIVLFVFGLGVRWVVVGFKRHA